MTGQCRVDLKLNRFISARQHWPVGRNTYIWIKKGSDAAGVPSVCMDRSLMHYAIPQEAHYAVPLSLRTTTHGLQDKENHLYMEVYGGREYCSKSEKPPPAKRCFFCGLFNKRLGAVEFVLSYRFGRFLICSRLLGHWCRAPPLPICFPQKTNRR